MADDTDKTAEIREKADSDDIDAESDSEDEPVFTIDNEGDDE